MTGGAPSIQISTMEYSAVCKLIKHHIGITLGDNKQEMLIARLGKRLIKFGLPNFHEYIRILEDPNHRKELEVMIDLVTTHETYFWREHSHFDWVINHLLKEANFGSTLRAWSAACSYGHEAYTLAIQLHEHLHGRNYEIVCSDISEKVLEVGRAGIYPEYEVDKVPWDLRCKYFLKGVRSQEGLSRINDDVRKRLSFRCVNLKMIPLDIGIFDIVFLRNVLIYFDEKSKREIVDAVTSKIQPGGYLVLAHSEALIGGHAGLTPMGRSIYKKEA